MITIILPLTFNLLDLTNLQGFSTLFRHDWLTNHLFILLASPCSFSVWVHLFWILVSRILNVFHTSFYICIYIYIHTNCTAQIWNHWEWGHSFLTLGDREYETQISNQYPFFPSFISGIRYGKQKHTKENILIYSGISVLWNSL